MLRVMQTGPSGVAARICAILAAAPDKTMRQADLIAAAGLRDKKHLWCNVHHMVNRGQIARTGSRTDRAYTLLRGPDLRPIVARAGLPFRLLEFIYTGEGRRRTAAEMRGFRKKTNTHLFGVAMRNLRLQDMLDLGETDVGLTQRGQDAMDRVIDLSAIEASSVDDGSIAQLLDGDDIQRRIEEKINASAEGRWAKLMGDKRFEDFRLRPMPLVQYARPAPVRSMTGSSAAMCALGGEPRL